jgi:hypothetical protein
MKYIVYSISIVEHICNYAENSKAIACDRVLSDNKYTMQKRNNIYKMI